MLHMVTTTKKIKYSYHIRDVPHHLKRSRKIPIRILNHHIYIIYDHTNKY